MQIKYDLHLIVQTFVLGKFLKIVLLHISESESIKNLLNIHEKLLHTHL